MDQDTHLGWAILDCFCLKSVNETPLLDQECWRKDVTITQQGSLVQVAEQTWWARRRCECECQAQVEACVCVSSHTHTYHTHTMFHVACTYMRTPSSWPKPCVCTLSMHVSTYVRTENDARTLPHRVPQPLCVCPLCLKHVSMQMHAPRLRWPCSMCMHIHPFVTSSVSYMI